MITEMNNICPEIFNENNTDTLINILKSPCCMHLAAPFIKKKSLELRRVDSIAA